MILKELTLIRSEQVAYETPRTIAWRKQIFSFSMLDSLQNVCEVVERDKFYTILQSPKPWAQYAFNIIKYYSTYLSLSFFYLLA